MTSRELQQPLGSGTELIHADMLMYDDLGV
jgi:hypothetical protein